MARLNFKNIDWPCTLRLNLFRAAFSGVGWYVIFIIFGIFGNPIPLPPGMPGLWVFIFVMPLGYLMILPIAVTIHRILNFLFLPLEKLVLIIPTIIVMPADPIIYIFLKKYMLFIPNNNFKFINFSYFLIVEYNNAVNHEEALENSKKLQSNNPCRFVGAVYLYENVNIMGNITRNLKQYYVIKEDWSIIIMSGAQYGWIDIDGKIHRGISFSKIYPEAVLAPGYHGIYIMNNYIYKGDKRIGEILPE